MNFFEVVLNTIVPVFALVGVGALFGPRLGLDVRTLSRVAYVVFVPAFVLRTLATTKLETALVLRVALYAVVVHVLCAALAYLVALVLRRDAPTRAAYVLVAVFGNVGNFGLPLVQFDLGREALGVATVYFLVILTVSFVVGVAAANWRHGVGGRAALEVFKTPAIVALWPALLLNVLGWGLPLPLERGLGLLADAMVPVMLLALGVQLAQTGWPRLSQDVVVSSVLRLVGGAGLAWLLAPLFGVVGLERSVGILQSAMPTAVLASIIALEQRLRLEMVLGAVVVSTVLSFVSLSVLMLVV